MRVFTVLKDICFQNQQYLNLRVATIALMIPYQDRTFIAKVLVFASGATSD